MGGRRRHTRWACDDRKKMLLGVIRDQISPNSTPKPCFGTMLLTFRITKYKAL